MKLLLEKYENDYRIGEITGFKYPNVLFNIPIGYKYDIFFMNRTSSWGWGTWKDRWMNVDWDFKDKNEFSKDFDAQKRFNSGGVDLSEMLLGEGEWDLIWAYHNFKNDRLTVYPTMSYVKNIGLDGTGVHCASGNEYVWKMPVLNMKLPEKFPKDVYIDPMVQINFRNIFAKGFWGKIRGIRKRIYKIINKFK